MALRRPVSVREASSPTRPRLKPPPCRRWPSAGRCPSARGGRRSCSSSPSSSPTWIPRKLERRKKFPNTLPRLPPDRFTLAQLSNQGSTCDCFD